MYKSIFIDLDDTVWAFSENARDTFQDMYEKYHFERYFDSFHQFYTIYSGRNEILWGEYGAGHITKDELNDMRFSYPLQQVGVEDKALVKAYSDDFFAETPRLSPLRKERAFPKTAAPSPATCSMTSTPTSSSSRWKPATAIPSIW